jgi:hypothetical protein
MKTISEAAFERFLFENHLAFNKVQESATPRPDYLVHVRDVELVFEVKELTTDENFGDGDGPAPPIIRTRSRIIGEHVRSKIFAARKQIQYAAMQEFPSILLIYDNVDSPHLFATEDHDFTTAMYGEYAILIDKSTKKWVGESFYGRRGSLQQNKNTSFGAVGRLHPTLGVTLFENAFAEVKIPYDKLPSCFDVRRIKFTQAAV